MIKIKSTRNILLTLILLALILRLPNINANFSGDEIDLAGPGRHFVINGDFRQFNECSGEPFYNYTHPPVRLILYSAWASLAGFTNIALRLLPLMFGLWSIILIYILGKELYSRNVGLIAALLAVVSRYHIYASNTLNTDTGHFLFFVTLSALSFLIYKKGNNRQLLLLSFLSFIIAFLTKFSAILIIPPLLFYSFKHNKKTFGKDTMFFTFSIAFSFLTLYVISFGIGSTEAFTQPFASFSSYASATPPTFEEFIYNKMYYIASISWQFTPFLAVLLIFSIFRSKKTTEFYFLLSWLVLMTAAFFYTFNQDAQRFFVIALPAAFILIAKYLEGIKLRDKFVYASFIAVLVMSLLIGLNDLMIFYEPLIFVIFYLIALIFAIPRYRKYLLIGGFTALSVYSVIPDVTIWSINSSTIEKLSENVAEYPYNEVWTSKDVSFYITPMNETVRNCNIYEMPGKNFLETNNVKYFVFYNIYEGRDIEQLAFLCSEYDLVEVRGYTTGIACKI